MKCPVCTEPDLLMTARQGIEIDYCPKCRGVWLDRGELDKLIERSEPAPAVAPVPRQDDYRRDDDDRRGDDYRRDDPRRHHKKKRGGFLGDLFDFD